MAPKKGGCSMARPGLDPDRPEEDIPEMAKDILAHFDNDSQEVQIFLHFQIKMWMKMMKNVNEAKKPLIDFLDGVKTTCEEMTSASKPNPTLDKIKDAPLASSSPISEKCEDEVEEAESSVTSMDETLVLLPKTPLKSKQNVDKNEQEERIEEPIEPEPKPQVRQSVRINKSKKVEESAEMEADKRPVRQSVRVNKNKVDEAMEVDSKPQVRQSVRINKGPQEELGNSEEGPQVRQSVRANKNKPEEQTEEVAEPEPQPQVRQSVRINKSKKAEETTEMEADKCPVRQSVRVNKNKVDESMEVDSKPQVRQSVRINKGQQEELGDSDEAPQVKQSVRANKNKQEEQTEEVVAPEPKPEVRQSVRINRNKKAETEENEEMDADKPPVRQSVRVNKNKMDEDIEGPDDDQEMESKTKETKNVQQSSGQKVNKGGLVKRTSSSSAERGNAGSLRRTPLTQSGSKLIASAEKKANVGIMPHPGSSGHKLYNKGGAIKRTLSTSSADRSNTGPLKRTPMTLSGSKLTMSAEKMMPKKNTGLLSNVYSFLQNNARVRQPTAEDLHKQKMERLREKEQKAQENKLRMEEAKKADMEKKRLKEEERRRKAEENRRKHEEEIQEKAKTKLDNLNKFKELQKKKLAALEAEKKKLDLEKAKKTAKKVQPTKPALNVTYDADDDDDENDDQEMNSTFTKPQEPRAVVDKVESYDITPARHELPPEPLLDPENYNIDDLNSGDDTDDEDQPRKKIPAWANGELFRNAILSQAYQPPDLDDIFYTMEMPDLANIFSQLRKRFFKRTSSAHWDHAPGSFKLD